MACTKKDADCCDEDQVPTIAEDIVVTKYKMAAEIVNRKFFSAISSLLTLFVSIEKFFKSNDAN